MDWYLLAWKRAGDVYGRSRRKEYWMFSLFHFLVSFGLLLFALALREFVSGTMPVAFYSVYSLLALIPSTTCAVRRLHDTGKSGWWLLISAVPFIGLILIVFLVLEGDSGANQYGPDPKLSVQPSAPDFPTGAPAVSEFPVAAPSELSTPAFSSSAAATEVSAPASDASGPFTATNEDMFIASKHDTFSATNEDYDAWNYHLAHRNPLARRPGSSIKGEHDAFMAARIKARAAAAAQSNPAPTTACAESNPA
jgi:uncharacterized membrane protein YhaH (DUF805 family)